MATRMQQRRGTAAQWTAANPVLGAGEIGFETDTNKFKIGNGSTAWTSLSYFVDGNAVIDGAPELLNTLNELAAALGDDPSFFTTVANNLSNHESDTTNVHGIANTSLLVTTDGTQTLTNKTLTTPTINGGEITATGGTPRIHGIYLPDSHFITFEGATNNEFETVLSVIDPTADRTISLPNETGTVQLRVADVSDTEIGYLNGVTSSIQTQIDTKAPLASPALSGIPTAPTANAGTNSTQVATTAYADAAVAALVDSAPAALNTLNELAQALNDDADFAVIVTNSFASVQNSLSTLSNSLSVTSSAVGVLEGNVVSISNDLTITQNNLNTTNGAIDGLANSISSLSNSLTTTQNSLASTQNSLATTNTNVDSLSNSISAASGNITGLQNSLANTISDLSTHASANTSVHGISNTLNLVYTNDSRLSDERTPISDSVTASKIASNAVETGKIANAAVTAAKIASENISDSHISNSAAIAQYKISGLTTDLSTIANNIATKQDKISGVTDTEIGYLDGVTSNVQSQIDGKASLSGATFTGSVEIDQNLTVDGNFIVNGSNVIVSATQIQIEDTLLQLGHTNANNISDLGLVTSYNDGTQKHSGLVKDVTDGKWKLFDGVTSEPATTVDFTQGTLDTLALKFLEANTVTVSAGVGFPDGTQTKEGVPSRTPIISKTDSYTLTTTSERDSLIEVNSASAATLTIPLNSEVAFPVGTTLDILQTGAGQVTIAGAGGVTVNATPGLKLRTQWSSVTLFKRAENTWVVFGDLSA
jgi:peptidoglycan hydrolase CwlO-like protein